MNSGDVERRSDTGVAGPKERVTGIKSESSGLYNCQYTPRYFLAYYRPERRRSDTGKMRMDEEDDEDDYDDDQEQEQDQENEQENEQDNEEEEVRF
jgi:hypothetical protein